MAFCRVIIYIYIYIYIYYIDTDIYARFFSYEKPFRYLFLTSVIQSESWNDFFTREKNRFVQSVRACVYIAVNSFTAGKLFGEIFFKLLAACVLLLKVYFRFKFDTLGNLPCLQRFTDNFIKYRKYVFEREICKQKTRQLYHKLYQNKQLGKTVSCIYIILTFWDLYKIDFVFFAYLKEKLKTAGLLGFILLDLASKSKVILIYCTYGIVHDDVLYWVFAKVKCSLPGAWRLSEPNLGWVKAIFWIENISFCKINKFLNGKCLCTVFTHLLICFRQTHSLVALARSFCENKLTRVKIRIRQHFPLRYIYICIYIYIYIYIYISNIYIKMHKGIWSDCFTITCVMFDLVYE